MHSSTIALPGQRSHVSLFGIVPKTVLLLGHLLIGLVVAYAIAAADLLRLGRGVPRERIARWWHRDLLAILKVRVRQRGAPLRSPHLAVANHVSWLDIIVIGACTPTRFVSRHDVKDWPVAGTLADACGTFYVRRGGRSCASCARGTCTSLCGGRSCASCARGTCTSLCGGGTSKQTLAAMTPYLERGSVTLFPEGTTTDGTTLLPFHRRLFEAALDAGVPVQPIALHYTPADDGTPIAPFIGDMTLVGHVWQVLRACELHVDVRFCASLIPDAQTTRDGLAAQAHRRIERTLQATRSRASSGDRYQ